METLEKKASEAEEQLAQKQSEMESQILNAENQLKESAETIEDVSAKLQLIFRFTELSVSDLSKAIALRLDDFEDALQIATASRLKVDYIITRNVKDFIESETPVVTPDEYLTKTLENLSESYS